MIRRALLLLTVLAGLPACTQDMQPVPGDDDDDITFVDAAAGTDAGTTTGDAAPPELDAAVPDGGVPDGGVPDGGVPDGGVLDASAPDAGTPDAA